MDATSIDFVLLVLGFIFTFFIPGFLIMETFFKELSLAQKLPLYLLLSVLTSTYAVYIISLVIGFSRFSVILSFLIFMIWLFILFIKGHLRIGVDQRLIKRHWVALFLSLIIFVLFLTALYPGIFSHYQNYFVMSAVNWQDTAMHLSIIETIAQGNFPPQAPYFSGQPLNYYYFIDLHSAILQVLYGNFFPRILVYDNPFFILIFFLSIYTLAYDFFKSRLIGVISGLIATFCGNFLYLKFFQDLFNSLNKSTNPLMAIKDQIANHGYTLDYQQLMQMVPVADYFLQNRPMMIGLSSIVLLIFLLKNGFERKTNKYFILSGLLTGALIKFQLFAFGIGVLTFLLSWFVFTGKDFRRGFIKLGYYFVPLVILFTFTSLLSSSTYAISAFITNFRLGPWDQTKDLLWYVTFPFANFGVPTFLFLLFILLTLLKRVNLVRNVSFLLILSAVLYAIPHLVYFTVYDGDMLKFFYFLLIPLSLIAGLVLQRVWYKPFLGPIIVIILILVSSFNSFLTLGWSFFNKYQGYSDADYQAGMWVRENTKANSIFMTMPTVHSSVSDIGGRLRVLSYIVWPYSHGFNKGVDNVFTRDKDIQSVYESPFNDVNLKRVIRLYNISYIYVGQEENDKFPLLKEQFKLQSYLSLVYDSKEIQIYKVL